MEDWYFKDTLNGNKSVKAHFEQKLTCLPSFPHLHAVKPGCFGTKEVWWLPCATVATIRSKQKHWKRRRQEQHASRDSHPPNMRPKIVCKVQQQKCSRVNTAFALKLHPLTDAKYNMLFFVFRIEGVANRRRSLCSGSEVAGETCKLTHIGHGGVFQHGKC
eukprot:2516982-Amphidinium_carterae.2